MNALYRLQSVNTSLVQVVPRLLASWFIVGLGFSVSNFDYFSLDYIDKMSGLLFTVCILLVYFLLSCIQTISKQDCDMIALGLGSTLYAVQLIYANPSGYLLLGIFLFQILYFIYYHKAFLRLSLSIWRSNYRVLIFFSIFAVCSGLLYLLYFFDAKFGTTFLLTNNANLKAYFSDILGDTTFFQILKIGFLEFLFIIYYAKLHKIFARIPINKILFGVLISLPIICTATYVAMITISRYELSRSSTFDMGIFAQMFYNLKEYFTLNTTCERNHLLSHNQIHTSVFYYLLYPIYKLCPNPKTLLVMQASAVAIGFIPLQSICKIYHFSHKQRIAIGFIYTLSAATWGGCFYDFHENVFLVPTLMFLFFFYEKYNASNRTKYNAILTVIMALLVCSIKEDAPLFVIVFGLYLLLGKKEIKLGWSILILGVICMISAFAYLSTVGEGLMTNHYYSLTTNGSIASIFKTLLCNPGYLLIQMFDANKLKFIFTMLLPVGMIPFFTRKYSRFILFIPFLFVNILT